jgi:DNA-binding PadR family transcriptional regulator
MLKRLSEQGLVENTQAHTKRLARAWRLTADGEAVLDAHRGGRDLIKAQRKTARGGKLAAKNNAGRRSKHEQIAAAGTDRPHTRIRMTALTRQVLATVAELSEWGANPTNRKIAQAAGVKDEGQISKLLARLQAHGLLQNTGALTKAANAWRLTPRGQELLQASRPAPQGATR